MDRDIWIFGSWGGNKFADNSKYLFLYVVKEHPEIRPIWLTAREDLAQTLMKEGYEAYTNDSSGGRFYTKRAECVIVCGSLKDVNTEYIGTKKRIHLFHGIPLKKGELEDTKHISSVDYYDMLIATSEINKHTMCATFGVSSDKVHITGLPRHDFLMDAPYLGKCDCFQDFQKVYTYLPTFRDGVRDLDLFSDYGFQVEEVEDFLKSQDAVLVMKSHRIGGCLKLPCESERIFNIHDDDMTDVYPLLKRTDVLITDYSSVYFDFLLLDRPIIFAPFDIDRYTKECREFNYNYDEVTPGPKAKNWKEVFQFIGEDWKKEREEVRSLFHQFKDNKNSERVFKCIKNELEDVWGILDDYSGGIDGYK